MSDIYNCNDFVDTISLYIDEQLSADEVEKFEKHAETCKHCKTELISLQMIVQDLNELPEIELPEGFHNELMSKIHNTTAVKKKKREFGLSRITESLKNIPFGQYALAATSAACCILILSTVMSFFELNTWNNNAPVVSELAGTNYKIGTSGISEEEGISPETQKNSKSLIIVEEGVAEDSQKPSSASAIPQKSAAMPIDPFSKTSAIIKSYNIKINAEDFAYALSVTDNLSDYISNKSVNEYDNYKEAYLSIKAPADMYDYVINVLKSTGKIEYEYQAEYTNTYNVSDSYSHMVAKEKEYQRIFSLLEKTSNVNEMILIDSRLSQLISDIDYYKSDLKQWNNLEKYPSIEVTIVSNENKITDVYVEPTFFDNVSNIFASSISTTYNVLVVFTQIIVFLIPFIAIIGITLITVFFIRQNRRKDGVKSGKSDR